MGRGKQLPPLCQPRAEGDEGTRGERRKTGPTGEATTNPKRRDDNEGEQETTGDATGRRDKTTRGKTTRDELV
eukprot:4318238-Pyramimonas_sp.AAC.1